MSEIKCGFWVMLSLFFHMMILCHSPNYLTLQLLTPPLSRHHPHNPKQHYLCLYDYW